MSDTSHQAAGSGSQDSAEVLQDWTLQNEDHAHHSLDHYTPNALDLGVVGFALVVLVVSLVLSVRWLIRPGEGSADHIKRRILRDGGQL